MAAHARRVALQDAAALHVRGVDALARGERDEALDDLRRATSKDRANAEFALSYARALAANGQEASAQRVLLTLHEAAPDNPLIDVELARLAAAASDLEMAVRYYRAAMYAPWRDVEGRRRVRDELIQLLLRRNDRERAVAELMAARANAEEQPDIHVRLGALFMQANEPRMALDEFRHALRLRSEDDAIRRQAGEAAFAAGDYAGAARDLAKAVDDPHVADMRSTALAVIRLDPLVGRIGTAERERRVTAMLAYTTVRVGACAAAGIAPPSAAGRVEAARREARRSHGRDTDVVEAGVDAAVAAIQEIGGRCGTPTPEDRAILIIGARHAAEAP